MGSDHHDGNYLNGELEEKRFVSDDNFVVEMDPFSLLMDKQMNVNPVTFTLQRNLSRKGSTRVGDPIVNQGVTATSWHEGSTPEKAVDVSIAPPLHHLITIANEPIRNTSAVESKILFKKFSFRSQMSIDPRRMFLFFATMSSLGTMLLIYFTLSGVGTTSTRDDNLLS